MKAVRQSNYFGDEEKIFLRALLYFDIFNYPLTAEEVTGFSPAMVNSPSNGVLQDLISRNLVFKFQNFYTTQNNEGLIQRRLKGNALADKKMKVAKRISYLLSLFPFVRAVLLSGSISKNYMDENSDIDYFIVTAANRLWIVRTALAIFRRMFLFNSHKYLCTNYFIDIQNLEIREKNIFTAIELMTAKAMFGRSTIEKLRSSNQWSFSFLPNFTFDEKEIPDKSFFLKSVIEKILSFKGVDKLNRQLMNRTIARWKKKYGHCIHVTDFEIAFRSTDGVSKSHPQFYQKKVLTIYEQKIKEFEIMHGLDLTI